MSSRPNHTAAGLGFVLACLLIAFAIYVDMKAAPRADANAAANSTAANANAVDATNEAAAQDADPGPPPDPENSAAPAAQTGVDASPAGTSSTAAMTSHADFYRTCAGAEGRGFDGLNDSEKPAMCECLYSRLASYGKMTRENDQLALNICRLQFATDRDRFDQTYTPAAGGSAAPTTEPDGADT